MSIAAVRVSGNLHARSARKAGLLATTALIAALSVVSVPAFAQTWDGDANKNFLVDGNWDGNVAPAAGGAVVLDDGALTNQPILNAGDAAVVDTVAVSAGTLQVRGNLSANSGVTVTGGIVRVGAAGSISGDAETSGAGRLLLDGSLTGDVTNGGLLTVQATSVVDGDVTSSGTGTNAGRITGALGVTGGTFGNSGVVDGATSVSGGVLSLNAGSNLADAGTLTVSGTGTLTVNAAETVRAVNLTGGTIEGAATLTTTTFAQSGGELAGTVSATGAKTLSGGIISGVLTGAGVVTVQTGTTTVSGTIDSDVRVADSGTLRLGTSNAVAGTIRTTGSVISYANGVNEASAVIISSNTTQLEVLGADVAEQSGAIGQAGGARPVEKIGTGTLLLSGANTYSGATTVTAGTLNVSGGAALSNTAVVNVAAGASLGVLADERVGALAGAGNVALTGSLTTGNATSSAFSGVASGAGGLTKLGNGTFTLSNTNTYTGATTVNAGTLAVTGSIASAVVTLNGGATLEVDGASLADTAAVTLNNASNLTLNGDERIGSLTSASPNTRVTLQGNTLTTGDAGDTAFAGNIGGTGGVTKEGAGTFTLSRTNAYTGATTVNAGVLDITGSVASGVVTVNGGSVRVDGASLANAAAVTLNGTGNLTLTGSEVIGSLASGSVTSTVTLGANTLTTGAAGNTSFAGVIGGTGGVTKQGAGTFTLSGTNTYTGLTQVNAGTLEVTGSVAGNVTIADAGRLRIGNSNAIGGSITTTGSVISYANGVNEASAVIVNSNTTQLEVLAADAATQSGVISELGGARPVEKIGTGTLTLSGANTFTGDLTVTGGTLAVTGGAALNDAVEVIVGAAGTFRVDASEDIGALTSASATAAVAIGANDLTIVGAQNTTYAGTLAGTGLLVNSGSARLELTGNGAAFTGVVGATGAGSEIAITGTGRVNATAVGSSAGATFSTDGGAILASNAVLGVSGQVTFTGSETVGTVTNDTGAAIANGTITLTGAGTILTVSGNPNVLNPGNLNGTNSTINGTGTLNIQGGVFNVGATGNVLTTTTVSEFAALVNNGTMAGVGNAGNFLNIGSAGALTNTGAGNGTNTGTLASLTHNSTGLFVNQGTVTGNTTVSNGTLRLEGASNLGDASTLQVTGGIVNSTVADTIGTLDADGGTLNLSANLTAGTLTGDAAGRIVGVAASTLSVGGSNANASFAGQISGVVALDKVGTGTQTMTGANSYTGGTTVSQGILFFDNAGTQTGTNFTINAGATLQTDGGALTTAAVVQNAGTFVLSQGGSESIAAITSGAGSAITMTGGSVLTLNTGASAIAGVISGAGGLTVQGTSATTLSGANTYTGLTTVTAGSLTLQNGAAIRNTATVQIDGGILNVANDETVGALVANGGITNLTGVLTAGELSGTAGSIVTTALSGINTGDSDGTDTSFAGVISGGGFVQKLGTDTLTFTSANTYTGGTTVSGGSLVLSGAGAVSSASVAIGAGGSLRTDGSGFSNAAVAVTNNGGPAGSFGLLLTGGGDESIGSLSGVGRTDLSAGSILTLNTGASNVAGVISGAGGLVVTGTSATTLTGLNTFTGATDVTGTGSLSVTGAGRLASTDIETAAGANFATDGGALLAATQITNAGGVSFAGSESIASLNGAGTVALTGGTLTLNTGASVIDGIVSGAGGLTVAGGTTTLSNAANANTGLTSVSAGTLILTGRAGGAVTVTGGELTVNAGTVAGVTTNTGGVIDIAGGTFAGGLVNTTGTVEAEGAIAGNISNAATFTTTAGVTSDLASTFTNTGTVNVLAGSLENFASFASTAGAVTVGAGRTLGATTVSNAGTTVFVINAGTIAGAFNNAGTVQVNGNVSFAGTLTNTGIVDLDNGVTGDVLTINASAANAGTFLMDLNLNTGTADRVDVLGGGVAGAVLDFNIPAGRTFVGGPITVFSGAAAGSLAGFTSADLPDVSGIIYALGQTGDEIQVVSLVNPAVSGIAAASAVTQSLIATVVNRPTSPFVSGLAAEETCSSGGYARATGGKATADGTSVSNGIAVTNAVSATYGGIQGGYDFGCFDGRYANGWDGAIGIMGGVNFGSTEQDVFANPLDKTSAITGTSGSDFNQSYLGVYVAASKDKFSGDVQLRFDRTEFELSEIDNPATPGSALVGFDKAKFDTRTSTLGARFNYRIDLNEENGISLVPTIGFTHSRTSGDTVVWDGGNQSLRLEPYSSTVGFVGATLTRTKVAPSGTAATTLFASGNYYQDFTGDRDSTYVNIADGVNQPIILENIGGFGEASIGVNYVKVLEGTGSAGAKQFNANIRADARFGGNVSEAYSLTAQVRLSF